MKYLLITMIFTSMLFAGNPCRGFDIEKDAFGDVKKEKWMRLGNPSKIDGTIRVRVESINGEKKLIVELLEKKAMKINLPPNAEVVFRTNSGKNITLHSIDEVSPKVGVYDSFTTYWHPAFNLTDDVLSQIISEGVIAIRAYGVEENVYTYELRKDSQKMFIRALECIKCIECE